MPDNEAWTVINDLERPIRTHLYGRRMYETMVYWETASTTPDQPALIRDFTEIWRAAAKIVYSRTLETVSSARTRLEREFDIDLIRRLKETSESDITVGGAQLAGHAMRAGLVDELHLFLTPSSWVAASPHSRTTSAQRSSFSTSAASEAALFTSTTA